MLGTGFAGPAVADDTTATDTPEASETATPTDVTGTDTPTPTPPPTSATSTTPTSTPTSPTSTSPTSTSTSPTSSTEPPPTTPNYDGHLAIRAMDVMTGENVSGANSRIYLYEDGQQDLPLPATMTLPAGHYRVELLGVPAGYRLVSAWHMEGVVKVGETTAVVFQLQPVSGSTGRVPIQSIPSGRTR